MVTHYRFNGTTLESVVIHSRRSKSNFIFLDDKVEFLVWTSRGIVISFTNICRQKEINQCIKSKSKTCKHENLSALQEIVIFVLKIPSFMWLSKCPHRSHAKKCNVFTLANPAHTSLYRLKTETMKRKTTIFTSKSEESPNLSSSSLIIFIVVHNLSGGVPCLLLLNPSYSAVLFFCY